jgi:hypothetical protein
MTKGGFSDFRNQDYQDYQNYQTYYQDYQNYQAATDVESVRL